jgi:hypothetical protein
MRKTFSLVTILAICTTAASSVPAQVTRRIHGELGFGAFAPLVDLGASGGYDARIGSGVDVRLGVIIGDIATRAVRVGIDVVPATSTRIRPNPACASDCVERSITTWILSPGVDALWGLRGSRVYFATGIGASMYARSIGDCVDLVGRFCASRYAFTKDAVVSPSGRAGIGARLRRSGWLTVEADDFLTPTDGGRLQHDLRTGLNARF